MELRDYDRLDLVFSTSLGDYFQTFNPLIGLALMIGRVRMENRIIVIRDRTSEVKNIPIPCNVKHRRISEMYLSEKFSLEMERISEDIHVGSADESMELEIIKEQKNEVVDS